MPGRMSGGFIAIMTPEAIKPLVPSSPLRPSSTVTLLSLEGDVEGPEGNPRISFCLFFFCRLVFAGVSERCAPSLASLKTHSADGGCLNTDVFLTQDKCALEQFFCSSPLLIPLPLFPSALEVQENHPALI